MTPKMLGITITDKQGHPIFSVLGNALYDSNRMESFTIIKCFNPLVELDSQGQKIMALSLLPFIKSEMAKQGVKVHYSIANLPIETRKPQVEVVPERDWTAKLDYSKEDIISADSPDELNRLLHKRLTWLLQDQMNNNSDN